MQASFCIVGEQYRHDFPAVLAFGQVQAQLAGDLFASVDQDEVGAQAPNAPAHGDADVFEAFGDLAPGGEVVFLACDEFLERAGADGAVGVRGGDDDRGVEQGLPAVKGRGGVEADVVGDQLVDGGACRVCGGNRGRSVQQRDGNQCDRQTCFSKVGGAPSNSIIQTRL